MLLNTLHEICTYKKNAHDDIPSDILLYIDRLSLEDHSIGEREYLREENMYDSAKNEEGAEWDLGFHIFPLPKDETARIECTDTEGDREREDNIRNTDGESDHEREPGIAPAHPGFFGDVGEAREKCPRSEGRGETRHSSLQ